MIHHCEKPKFVYNKYTKTYVSVPCGRCASCLSLKQLDLVTRMQLESSQHRYCMFFTLTYSEEYVPFKFGVRSVDRSDVQKFLKRFRRSVDRLFLRLLLKNQITISDYAKKKIRYFICSEYGPKTLRPHYHGLLWFDSPEISCRFFSLLRSSWPFGRIDYSPSRDAAGSYCAKYVSCTSHYPPLYAEPELHTFCLYSKMPALGFKEDHFKEVQNYAVGRSCENSFIDTSRNAVVPFYKSLENRLFPKCRGFNNLSFEDRISTYNFSKQIDRLYHFSKGIMKPFSQWLLDYSLETCRDDRMISMYYTSKKFIKNCHASGLTSDQYVRAIETYYKNKDLFNLKSMYNEQQIILAEDPSSLPYLVNYYDNFCAFLYSKDKDLWRKFPFSLRICSSFGFALRDRWKYHFSKFSKQNLYFSLNRKIHYDSLKTKKLNNHLNLI